MPKIVKAGSALDWYTIGQLCESATRELVQAHPHDPKAGRIDLYREVILNGRPYMVRMKLTLVHAVKR